MDASLRTISKLDSRVIEGRFHANDCVQQTQLAEQIRERSLLLDALEEYMNSSERSATVELAERDKRCKVQMNHIRLAT